MNINKNRLSYTPFGYNQSFLVDFMLDIPKNWFFLKNHGFEKALLVVDTSINKNFISDIFTLLQRNRLKINIYKFQYGPKSLKNLSSIWKVMVASVPQIIIGVGGGTLCDLVGLAAATYQRGIPHILFPTTTLGMVDASIGGKTAIDFGGVKNSIGAIQYPLLVVNIIKVLDTLPKQEFWSGFAEIVKAAVLFDKFLFKKLKKNSERQSSKLNKNDLLDILKHSAKLKMKNSEESPENKIKLLYGHAVGHALEILLKQSRHGDCVSIGMNIEGAVACQLGIWGRKQWLEQKKLLHSLNLPTEFPKEINITNLVNKMLLYKKLVKHNNLQLVLPKNIGEVANKKNKWLTGISQNTLLRLLNQLICAA